MGSGNLDPVWPASTRATSSSHSMPPLPLLSRLQLAFAYVVAVVLPGSAAAFAVHSRPFHTTPMALSFASIALVTVLSGLWPGIVASLSAAFGFALMIAPYEPLPLHGVRLFGHTAVIALLGILVAYLCERQRVTSRRLQLALDNLQHKTDALIEAQQASASVAWTYDTAQQRIHWAEGAAPIFGLPFDSIPGLPLELVFEEDRSTVNAEFESSIAASRPFQVEFRSLLPNRELRWFESRGTPSTRDKNLYRGVTIDITERKQAELALLRSEKLAAIGRLSATIAHEMNNPLEAVTNLLYLCSADGDLSPQTREYLDGADQELRRLASIARHTLSFARPRSSAGPTQTAVLIEGVVAMFQPRCAPRGFTIEIVHNPDVTVAGSGDELRQVLTNLVSNACDALEGPNGRIAIEVSTDEEFATIEVRDNGSGISAEDLDHIFDPFFTTKPDVGTGIGLWVTRELVEKNGGEIEVRTSGLPDGFRTAFRVQLPIAS